MALRPYLAADIEAIDIGQHQVQNDEVGVEGLLPGEGVLPVGDRLHGVSIAFQIQPRQLDDVWFVVYNKNRGRHYPS